MACSPHVLRGIERVADRSGIVREMDIGHPSLDARFRRYDDGASDGGAT